MTESFYDLLGVPPDATTEEIESAYRAAIKEVHPDVSDATDASQRTKRLNRAKKVLTDDEERARYDQLGHAAYSDGQPGGTGRSGEAGTDDPHNPDQSDDAGSAAASESGGHASGSTWGGSTQRGHRSGRKRRDRGNGSEGSAATGSRSDSTGHRDEASTDRSTGGASGAGSTAPGATRSRTDSRGPSWQSGSASATGGGGGTDGSRSARRQATARGPNSWDVDWSWNARDPQESWAVRQGGRESRGLHPSRLFPTDQSIVLIASTVICYPFFVGSILFPPFPLLVRLTVLVCTLFMFAYLLSIPEVAILVYGFWSVVGTLGLLLVPGAGLLSLIGVAVITATWVPLGLSVLTFRILRP